MIGQLEPALVKKIKENCSKVIEILYQHNPSQMMKVISQERFSFFQSMRQRIKNESFFNLCLSNESFRKQHFEEECLYGDDGSLYYDWYLCNCLKKNKSNELSFGYNRIDEGEGEEAINLLTLDSKNDSLMQLKRLIQNEHESFIKRLNKNYNEVMCSIDLFDQQTQIVNRHLKQRDSKVLSQQELVDLSTQIEKLISLSHKRISFQSKTLYLNLVGFGKCLEDVKGIHLIKRIFENLNFIDFDSFIGIDDFKSYFRYSVWKNLSKIDFNLFNLKNQSNQKLMFVNLHQNTKALIDSHEKNQLVNCSSDNTYGIWLTRKEYIEMILKVKFKKDFISSFNDICLFMPQLDNYFDQNCVICKGKLGFKHQLLTTCGHLFHKDCFRDSRQCPICKSNEIKFVLIDEELDRLIEQLTLTNEESSEECLLSDFVEVNEVISVSQRDLDEEERLSK